jgi:hypothetical protein
MISAKAFELAFGTTPSFRPCAGQPAPHAHPVCFVMPETITPGALPTVDAVRAACATPQGAVLDFSGVHGASDGGLRELTVFFSQFAMHAAKPAIRAMEWFRTGLKAAAMGDNASAPMWELLLAYCRFEGDEDEFDRLAIWYAVSAGIAPPPFKP